MDTLRRQVLRSAAAGTEHFTHPDGGSEGVCAATGKERARRRLLLLCVLMVHIPLLRPAQAQQRPLLTDSAELLPVGMVRTQIGVEFLQNQRFSLSGLEGDLSRIGVASVQVGVGEYAEFQISGVVRDFLVVSKRTTPHIPPDFAGNSTSDFGDISLATKLRMAPEKGKRPAFAVKFAVELPNASNESGLGIDETRFYASVLASKHFGRAQVLGSLGVAILPSPLQPNTQTDPLTYGLAVVAPVHPRVSLIAEINGRQGPEQIGNENHSQVRAGVQITVGGLRWDLAGIAGLKTYDPDSGVTLGLTWDLQAFHKKKRPATVK